MRVAGRVNLCLGEGIPRNGASSLSHRFAGTRVRLLGKERMSPFLGSWGIRDTPRLTGFGVTTRWNGGAGGALSSWDISEGLSDSFSTPTWGALGPKTRARASSRTTPRFPYAQDFVCLLVYVWASMLAVICKVDLTKWGSSVIGFCVSGFTLQECQA